MASGFVYFIQEKNRPDRPIKIGRSAHPRVRLLDLGCAYPFGELQILSCFEGERADERRLHERFAHLRLRREWFRPDASLLSLAYAGVLEDWDEAIVYDNLFGPRHLKLRRHRTEGTPAFIRAIEADWTRDGMLIGRTA